MKFGPSWPKIRNEFYFITDPEKSPENLPETQVSSWSYNQTGAVRREHRWGNCRDHRWGSLLYRYTGILEFVLSLISKKIWGQRLLRCRRWHKNMWCHSNKQTNTTLQRRHGGIHWLRRQSHLDNYPDLENGTYNPRVWKTFLSPISHHLAPSPI